MKRIAAILAVLVPLAVPAVASARSELSLAKADQATQGAVAEDAAAMNSPEWLEPGESPAEEGEATVLSYIVQPCDRETRYRALCDYTENWSDGVSCDQTATVVQWHGLHVALPELLDEAADCH
jgi:hypothetical protein